MPSYVHWSLRHPLLCSSALRSTDTDTATGIRHDETWGHGKFQKIRIRIRQGHDIIQ